MLQPNVFHTQIELEYSRKYTDPKDGYSSQLEVLHGFKVQIFTVPSEKIPVHN